MRSLFVAVTTAVLAACGGKDAATVPPTPSASPTLAQHALAARPAGAVSVVEAKKLEAGSCTVFGRIANQVPGFAVFTLMDTVLPYCGEKDAEDDCKTPWDYCCEPAKTRTAHSLLVEFRDAAGKPAAGSLGDLRLLDAVTVQGKLHKDEHGNHVLLASGWFRDARPTLPADLRWPK